jgi:hypothetical protein
VLSTRALYRLLCIIIPIKALSIAVLNILPACFRYFQIWMQIRNLNSMRDERNENLGVKDDGKSVVFRREWV